jgi:protein gp37
MADKTKIEWATSTWNPITGCTPISEGCERCYAANIARRFWGERDFSDIRFHKDRLGIPMKWKEPRMIFVCSMGDLFHRDIDIDSNIYSSIFFTISKCPQHTFIILTKRPRKMKWVFERYLNPVFKNVWVGVTAENQKRADERIPILLEIPAAARFVSVEPMLEEIRLRKNWVDYLAGWTTGEEHDPKCDGSCHYCPVPIQVQTEKLDWVICGGETGPGARYMKPKWPMDLYAQCHHAGVPFFFKKAKGVSK